MFIIDALSAFASWLVVILKYLITYLWSWLFARLRPIIADLLNALLDALPDIGLDPAYVLELLALADYWLPINECFAILISYWSYLCAAAAIRTIIKIIPTVG